MVLDDLSYESRTLFLSENSVMISGKCFEKNKDGTIKKGSIVERIMLADINEEGNFVNIRILEEN